MFLGNKNHRGESLIETIISIVLITLAVTAAITLIVTTMRASEASKERIIAINLAREGIEAVRAIRDTNWLVYSSRRRICWNTVGECNDNTPKDGITDSPINVGYYRVGLSSGFSWELEYYPGALESEWRDDYQLYLENNFYTHRVTDLAGNPNVKSNFARRIYVTYLDDDGNPGNAGDNRMEVTSEVRFVESGREHVINLVTHLSDYLGRESHVE